jgi:hypothetical protein
MSDFGEVARETMLGSKQIVASTKDLALMSDRLRTLIGHFVTEEGRPGSEPAGAPASGE